MFLFTSLRRVTSGGRFVPGIDGLRCVAIVAVLLYHLNGYVVGKSTGFSEQDARNTALFHWMDGANCGVQIFFAISGFILALPFARETCGGERVEVGRYYLRRLTRLEPPFLVNLAIVFGLLTCVRGESPAQLLPRLLATVTYTHNWIYGELSLINGVTWSLEIEVQFYLLAPIMARFFFGMPSGNRRTLIVAIVGLMIIAKMLNPVSGDVRLRLGLAYVVDHFLAGILMADIFVFRWREAPSRTFLPDLLTLPILILIFFVQRSDVWIHSLPVLTAGLLACLFCGRLTNACFAMPFVVTVGGMCYSIYLYHFFVISLLGRTTLSWTGTWSYEWQMAAQTALILPLTIAVCGVFFVLIERPFMLWRPGALRVASNGVQRLPAKAD